MHAAKSTACTCPTPYITPLELGLCHAAGVQPNRTLGHKSEGRHEKRRETVVNMLNTQASQRTVPFSIEFVIRFHHRFRIEITQ